MIPALALALGVAASATPAAVAERAAPAAADRAASPWDDPRMRRWSEGYLRRDWLGVAQDVESDLRSASPHPLAKMIWARLWRPNGPLSDRTPDPAARALAQPAVDILEAWTSDELPRKREILKRFPPDAARALRDRWSLLMLAWDAQEVDEGGLQLGYAAALLELDPEDPDGPDFVVGALASAPGKLLPFDRRKQLPFLADDSPAAREIDAAVRAMRAADGSASLVRAERVLATRPRDERALSQKAWYLASSGYHDAGAAAWEAECQAFPMWARWSSLALAQLRAGRPADAVRTIERWAPLEVPPAQAEVAIEHARVQLYRDAGDGTRAREALGAALRRWPDDRRLLTAQVEMELADRRTEVALPPARALALAFPSRVDAQLTLLKALRAARPAEAVSYSAELERRFELLPPSFYGELSGTFADLKRTGDRVAACRRGVARHPGSAWMLRELADALDASGRPADAMAALREVLALGGAPSDWHVDFLRRLAGEAGATKDAEAELARLRERYPMVKRLWDDADGRLPRADERRVALWREAVRVVPGQSWSWVGLSAALLNAKHWDEARATDAEAERALASAPPAVRAHAAWSRAETTLWLREQSAQLGPEDLEQALKINEVLRELSWNRYAYLYQRAKLLRALDRRADAAAGFVAAWDAAPDSSDPLWEIANSHMSLVGRGAFFSRALRYVERRPYDAKRMEDLVQLHVRYGGSPIVGLQWSRRRQERVPSAEPLAMDGEAWGQLGDHTKEFADYRRRSDVRPSDRYVHWFERARLQAEKPSSVVEISWDDGVATTTRPDGVVEKLQDHPITGNRMLVQVGPAWIRMRYDPEGELLEEIRSSSGECVRIEYRGKAIEFLRTCAGQEVRFEYGGGADGSKPTLIAVKGKGELRVAYGEGGEVASVEGRDASGTPQSGRGTALEVTSSFQSLMSLIRRVEQRSGEIELPHDDPKLQALERSFQEALAARSKTTSARALALAQHLVSHVQDRPAHRERAREFLDLVLQAAQAPGASPADVGAGISGIVALHELVLRTQKGLPRDEYVSWTRSVQWLEEVSARGPAAARPGAAKALALVRKAPLPLLENARWLPRSHLAIDAYWRLFDRSEMLPAALARSATLRTILVRANGDLVVGTDAGLAVRRRGTWRWYGVDEKTGRLSSSVSPSALGGASRIATLEEDGAGALVLGTADGLLVVPGDYDGELRRLRAADGLPGGEVLSLARVQEGILVGTSSGLALLGQSRTLVRAQGWPGGAPRFLRASEGVGLGGAKGKLMRWRGGRFRPVAALDADDAIASPSGDGVLILRGKELLRAPAGPGESFGSATAVPGQQDVVLSQRIRGLAPIPVVRDHSGVALLTDQGLSVLYDEHFEHVRPPLLKGPPDVRAMDTRDGRSYLVTDEGVLAIELGQVGGDSDGRVFDLLTFNDLGMTFAARGDRLDVVRHDAPSRAVPFDGIAATRLARDREGRLVANDGTTIVRYEKGSSRPTVLFDAEPSATPRELSTQDLTSILCASDGTIWVTAGASLFRWRDGATEEFSFFKDPQAFPSRSEMISRAVETVDHRIWVVASYENHLQWRGTHLEGGLLEWTGSRFERLDLRDRRVGDWFLTGYTVIDDRTAIAGTATGFARHGGGRLSTYRELDDPSYQAVAERVTPMLWLGTRGARLGEVWLFGSAGGIVAWTRGTWFWPDRVNWMLPDPQLYGRGARTVHAVETDSAGRVYAGTDRGLLIYDSGGGDAAGFLLMNRLEQLAFGGADLEQLRRERDVLFGALKPGTGIARKVEEVERTGDEIARLEQTLAPGFAPGPPRLGTPSGARASAPEAAAKGSASLDRPEPAPAEAEKLRAELAEKRRRQARLLMEIERENPALRQLVKLDPMELRSFAAQLPEGDVVVQYLPTPHKLYVQVVARDLAQVTRGVEVEWSEVEVRAVRVARLLAAMAARATPVDAADAAARLTVPSDLAWLYDQLLRPIESLIEGKKHVLVAAPGKLSYVPFAALVRNLEPRVEYAVERYAFGYVPDLYLLAAALKAQPSAASDALVMGDPDGTLHGAREEAETVGRLLGVPAPRLGNDATLAALAAGAPRARVVHLATHATLNPLRPERSYVQLANGERLTVVDAVDLPLRDTDLVTLSACETGLGADGMEYATLARAFALAGAPTVLATLWRIPDASAPVLMERVYRELPRTDRVAALAAAQRAMLLREDALREPQAWSGYVAIGRP
jgi:CHAT domain-containing protein/tetratricopeptide (TPR) repeat protein